MQDYSKIATSLIRLMRTNEKFERTPSVRKDLKSWIYMIAKNELNVQKKKRDGQSGLGLWSYCKLPPGKINDGSDA